MTPKKPKPLNHKQKLAALRYAIGPTAGNAEASYIAAGYGKRSASSAGPRLFTNVEVQKLVDEHLASIVAKAEVKGAAVLTELKHFAHSDLKDAFHEDGTLLPLHKMPEKIRRAIKSFEVEELFDEPDPDTGEKFKIGRVVKVSLWDKPKGLELLGKHDKLFTDKVEHTVSDSLADLLAMARAPATEDDE